MSDTRVTLGQIVAEIEGGRAPRVLTRAQEASLRRLCGRYGEEFHFGDYTPQFDLPPGYVAGWVGGPNGSRRLYVGCDPDGRVSS